MHPLEVWQGWTREVGRLVGGVSIWQRRALALFSLGMAAAQDRQSARVATVVPGEATAPSTTRRFERLLANPRLDVRAVRAAIGAAVLEQARGQTLWLALDETPRGHAEHGPRLVTLALRLVYRERAFPLAWVCYRPGAAPAPLPDLVTAVLTEVAALVPTDTRVVLLTDRGLSWPAVADHCRRLGWSFLLRVQGQTRIQTADGWSGPLQGARPPPRHPLARSGLRLQGRRLARRRRRRRLAPGHHPALVAGHRSGTDPGPLGALPPPHGPRAELPRRQVPRLRPGSQPRA